jgi:hypothetical protein
MNYIVKMSRGMKCHDHRFRHLSNIKVIASTILEFSVSVLLMR